MLPPKEGDDALDVYEAPEIRPARFRSAKRWLGRRDPLSNPYDFANSVVAVMLIIGFIAFMVRKIAGYSSKIERAKQALLDLNINSEQHKNTRYEMKGYERTDSRWAVIQTGGFSIAGIIAGLSFLTFVTNVRYPKTKPQMNNRL